MRRHVVVAGLILMGALAGCGASGNADEKPGSGASAADAPLADVAEKTSSATTMRIVTRITTQGSTIETAGVTDLAKKQGTFTTTVDDGDGMESIQDGSVFYEKLPPGAAAGSKPWAKFDVGAVLEGSTGLDAELFSQQSSSDPTTGLDYVRGVGQDVRVVGTTEVDGAKTTHYKATIDFERAARRVTDPARRAAIRHTAKTTGVRQLPVDLWVDAKGRLRKMQYKFDSSKFKVPDSAAMRPTGPATFVFEFSDFGVPFTMPALPAAKDVVDITDQLAHPDNSLEPTPAPKGGDLKRSVAPPAPGYTADPADETSDLNKATFTEQMGEDSAAVRYRFESGWDTFFAETDGLNTYGVTLMDFENPAAAQNFIDVAIGSGSDGFDVGPLRGIPTAMAGKAKEADDNGDFEFDIAARKGDRLMIIVVYNEDSAAAQRIAVSLAASQYALL